MQLGFVTAIFPDLSLTEVLRFAADTGYDCVEVMCWPPSKAERRYAGVTHIDCTEFGNAEADDVRRLIDETGVAVSGLGYYPNPLTPDAAEAEVSIAHIRRVIDATALLGDAASSGSGRPPQMNTFIGRDWTKSIDDNWPRFLEVWRPLIAYAEEKGVRIGIENCPMLFSEDEWPGGKNLAISPVVWRRMFADINSDHFGLNYDPSHPAWMQMDPIQPLWEFAGKLFHMHAKDVRVDRHLLNDVGILAHPTAYHTPKIPGLGDIDWGRFFSVLGDVGYDGPVCVEVEDRAFEGSLEARKKSLQQSATFLRNYI